MRYYQPNPACSCGRCSTRGLMGPAVLITIGLLFLLANTSEYSFERTWPILLIVIGAIKVGRYVMTDSGHVNPGQYPPPYGVAYGQYPPAPPYTETGYAQNGAQNTAQANGPAITPEPTPVVGESDHGEVHNG